MKAVFVPGDAPFEFFQNCMAALQKLTQRNVRQRILQRGGKVSTRTIRVR
jgi:hypothetical protein